MARPIVPTSIRRQRDGGPIEVRTAAGVWVDWKYLAPQSRTNVAAAVSRVGSNMDSLLQDPRPFSLDLQQEPQPRDPQAPAPAPQGDGDGDGDGQADDDDDKDGDGDNPAPQDPKSPMEVAIEDIVRRIAAEVADGLDVDREARVLAEINERLEHFKPEPQGGGLVPVLTQIIVKHRDLPPLPQDGLFHNQFPELVANIAAGLHTFLPGPPGTGKSHSAEQAANILGYMFGALSLGPTTPESRLWGGMDANGKFHEPPLIQCIRHAMENPDGGAVFCFDEMDNGHAGILATMNSAQANGWCFAPNGDKLLLGSNMVFIGAANTYGTGPTAEFSGRNKLDAATLDRFTYLPWDTDLGVEEVLVRQRIEDAVVASQWLDMWRTLRANVDAHGIKFFVTMRGAVTGAKIIAAGRTPERALMLTAGNKIPADQWRKVSPL